MPIVDVLLVQREPPEALPSLASKLANELGKELGETPGTLWVRLHRLPSDSYAENQATVDDNELPVFVTVLLSHPPLAKALEAHALAVSKAVSRATGRASERVHVEYAPGGAGRIAFGGKLAR